jgi:hypothetical protein
MKPVAILHTVRNHRTKTSVPTMLIILGKDRMMAFGEPGKFSEMQADQYNEKYGKLRDADYQEAYMELLEYYEGKGTTYGSETFEIMDYTDENKKRIDTIRDKFVTGQVSAVLDGA